MLIHDLTTARTIHVYDIDHVPAKYKRAVALLDAMDWDGYYLCIHGIGIKTFYIGAVEYKIEAGGIDE